MNMIEYKVLSYDSNLLTEANLNRLGREGWILITTLPMIILVRESKHAETIQRAEKPNERPRLLKVNQAAYELGIARTKMYELINSGQLKVTRLGRSVRIPVQALEEFIQKHSGPDR